MTSKPTTALTSEAKSRLARRLAKAVESISRDPATREQALERQRRSGVLTARDLATRMTI